MMAGNYMGDLYVFVVFGKMQPCNLKTPQSKHKGGYAASFSRSNIPGKLC